MVDRFRAWHTEGGDAVVLRIRAQQATALDGLEAQRRRRVGDDPEERVRDLVLQPGAQAQERRIHLPERQAALADQQVGALAADVGDLGDDVPRQFTLHVDVPLLHVRHLVGGEIATRAAADLQAEIRRRALGRSRRQVEAVREGIVDVAQRRPVAVDADDHVGLGVEADHAARARMAGRLDVRRHVEDAVAAADHRLLGEVPGEADARADVVVVGLDLLPVVLVHEHHGALQLRGVEVGVGRDHADERRRRVRIEIGQPVEPLGARRVEVVAEAEVDGEVAGDFPVVLQISTEVAARRGRVGVVAQVDAARDAQQHRGQPRTPGAARDVRIALRPLRVAETELAGRVEQLGEVEQELAVVGAHLQRVRAPDLGGVGVEAVRGRRDHQVGERVLAEGLEVLDVDAGDSSASTVFSTLLG